MTSRADLLEGGKCRDPMVEGVWVSLTTRSEAIELAIHRERCGTRLDRRFRRRDICSATTMACPLAFLALVVDGLEDLGLWSMYDVLTHDIADGMALQVDARSDRLGSKSVRLVNPAESTSVAARSVHRYLVPLVRASRARLWLSSRLSPLLGRIALL